MFDPIASPTATVAGAAHAAGFSLRGLRLALGTHDRFRLLGQSERAEGQWRRFAAVDVVRLAVLRRLLDYGFAVPDAADVLDRSLDRHLGGLVGCGVDLPLAMLRGRLHGLDAHVSRAGTAIHVETTPAGHPPRRAHDVWLTLDIGAIAAEALDRLAGRA